MVVDGGCRQFHRRTLTDEGVAVEQLPALLVVDGDGTAHEHLVVVVRFQPEGFVRHRVERPQQPLDLLRHLARVVAEAEMHERGVAVGDELLVLGTQLRRERRKRMLPRLAELAVVDRCADGRPQLLLRGLPA